MAVSRATKKEQVLELARQDPFLRVEEIATAAGTTTRYVRTVLSEAGLSLMDLRRQYARTMERRLPAASQPGPPVQGLVDMLIGGGSGEKPGPVRLVSVVESDLAELLGMEPSTVLFQFSCVYYRRQEPAYLTQIVTHKDLSLMGDMSMRGTSLRRLVGLDVPGRMGFAGNTLEVAQANAGTAAGLGLQAGAPVVKLSEIILMDSEPVAMQLAFVDALRMSCRFSGDFWHGIQIVFQSPKSG